jgi:hypothetical protein
MSYSDSFPSVSPSWQCNFSANGGRLDPRITFSRSDTPPTYAAPSAVHYWSNEKHLSSENLFVQSSDFDTSWSSNGILNGPTGGQSDPVGGTDGFELVESTSNIAHRVFQNISATGELALTVYAKQNSGTRYLMLKLFNADYNWEVAVFDLAGGAAATASGSSSTFTSVTTSQSASGNGFYKCVLKATGTISTANIALKDATNTSGLSSLYGSFTYTGDGSSSIDVAFASLTTTGATDYNATTTQIHREYAPTLKSVSYAGQPRFEFSPTDSASMGLLVEGSSTNLQRYGNDFGSWNLRSYVTITADAAVAPDGSLTAQSVVPTAISEIHYILDTSISFTSGTTYTSSVFVKSAGSRYIQFGGGSSAFGAAAFVNFDLTDGSYTATGMTATASAVGNDWWRLTVTAAATASATEGFYLSYVTSKSAARAGYATGDGYSGYLLYGFQTESGSFASSLVNTGTGSSALTRAAESLSVADSSLFDNGSGALAAEYDMFAASETSYVLQTARSTGATNNDGVTVYNEGLFVNGAGSNTVVGNTTSNTFHKVAASWEAGSQKISRDGGAVAEDTTTVVPQSGTDKLFIGVRQDGGEPLNGHIKRLAIYSEPLSSTNLISLTS